jgi:phosphate transport system substrate-binding protein
MVRLTGLALALSMSGGLTASAGADVIGTLNGAGSTLVAPLMANWAADFQARNNIAINYSAVGSGAGIAQISARTVDYGASDAPMTPDQFAACNGCVQIPWALTATVFAFNIPGVKTLKLTGPVAAQIYLGQITNWNDKRITSLNKGVKLPNLAITPAYRSDGSGDTYLVTDYLSHVSSQWKSQVGTATSVSFPKGVGGKGNDGVTAVVSSTKGAIGYVGAYYAIQHHLSAAALKNRAGRFVFGNLPNIKAAGAVIKHVPSNNEMHIVNPPKKARLAYPMSTFTYCILPVSTPNAARLQLFARYAISATGQRFAPALDFQPIPKVVSAAARRTIETIHSETHATDAPPSGGASVAARQPACSPAHDCVRCGRWSEARRSTKNSSAAASASSLTL